MKFILSCFVYLFHSPLRNLIYTYIVKQIWYNATQWLTPFLKSNLPSGIIIFVYLFWSYLLVRCLLHSNHDKIILQFWSSCTHHKFCWTTSNDLLYSTLSSCFQLFNSRCEITSFIMLVFLDLQVENKKPTSQTKEICFYFIG